jgi:hypothetical protein
MSVTDVSCRPCNEKEMDWVGYPLVKRKCNASYMLKHEDQSINAVVDDVKPVVVVWKRRLDVPMRRVGMREEKTIGAYRILVTCRSVVRSSAASEPDLD